MPRIIFCMIVAITIALHMDVGVVALAYISCVLCVKNLFFNKPDRRAADYINKKKGPDWTGNTTGGVYNLRQQLRMTKPNSTKNN